MLTLIFTAVVEKDFFMKLNVQIQDGVSEN